MPSDRSLYVSGARYSCVACPEVATPEVECPLTEPDARRWCMAPFDAARPQVEGAAGA